MLAFGAAGALGLGLLTTLAFASERHWLLEITAPAFRHLLSDGRPRDTGRGLVPTWPVSPWWLRIPLDHGLVADAFSVIEHRVGPDIGSDHFRSS